jgi:O-antigen/teichoic acid export membrane protein
VPITPAAAEVPRNRAGSSTPIDAGASVWQRIAFAGTAQVYSLLTGVALMFLTARWLGPSGRGTYAATITWVAMFSSILYMSLGQVAIHRATRVRSPEAQSETLGALLAVTLVVTVVGWLAAAVMFLKSGVFGDIDGVFVALGFLLLPFLIWEQYGSALLISTGRLGTYNWAQISGRTLVLIIGAAGWAVGSGVKTLMVGAVLGQIAVSLGGMGSLFSRAHPPRVRWQVIRDLLSGGMRLHWNYVGGVLLTSSGILMVNRYHGVAATGEYQLAQQGVAILAVIPQAASLVFLERIALTGPDSAWVQQRRVVAVVAVLSVAVACGAAILAPLVLPAVLGAKFAATTGLFQVTVLALPGMALAGVMSSQWIGRGKFVWISALTCGLAVVSVGLNYALIPRFGAIGASWVTVAVYALAAAVQAGMVIYCERHRGNDLEVAAGELA